ncbi:MAG: hypothetical protein K9N07_05820 [Candidatus Cloacimonetes bacterium]|nr:hypothetical protein [Candidatus Cloacimonadota bacterium]
MKEEKTSEYMADQYLPEINEGEKMYKFYIFRPHARKSENFEYRIVTKEMLDGKLELISYNFEVINDVPHKYSITRAKEITKNKMNEIVEKVMKMTESAINELEEIDLSVFDTIEEQRKFLEKRDKENKEYFI